MSEKVFVYGSLKKDFGNHRLLTSSLFLKEDLTKDSKFTMFSFGGFPGVYKGGNCKISGELYEVDDEVMKSLDRLESNGSFYQREEVELEGGDTAWMYITLNNGYDSSYKRRVLEEGGVNIWEHQDYSYNMD